LATVAAWVALLLGAAVLTSSCGKKPKHCSASELDSGGGSCETDDDCACDNQICTQNTCFVPCSTNADCGPSAVGNRGSRYCDTLKNGTKGCYTVPNGEDAQGYGVATCAAIAPPAGRHCNDPSYVHCGDGRCCPPSTPYLCGESCYAGAGEVKAAGCTSTCYACGGAPATSGSTGGTGSGTGSGSGSGSGSNCTNEGEACNVDEDCCPGNGMANGTCIAGVCCPGPRCNDTCCHGICYKYDSGDRCD
jgi:hypothetical protein